MSKKIFSSFFSLCLFLSICLAVYGQPLSKEDKKRAEAAKKLTDQGNKLFGQRKYREAIAKYDLAIVAWSNHPGPFFWKGYAHYYLNEYDAALPPLNTAQQLGFAQPLELYKVRSYIYLQKKDYANALKDLDAAIALQPTNSQFYTSKGDIYREQRSWQNALTAYSKASEYDAKNGDLYYFVALSNARVGDYMKSGASASSAIDHGTRYMAESWYLIGNSFQLQKKYPDAISSFDRAIAIKRDVYPAYTGLADVYRILGRFDDAIATVKKAQQFYPNDGNLYASLAWYYSLSDKHDLAVQAGQTATRLAPDQYLGYTNLCRAYNDTKQYALAVTACNAALKLEPNDGETYFYLARAYDFQKQASTATGYYKKAVTGLLVFTKNNPDYSDGFYLLGNAYYATDDYTNAINAYKRCLDLSPKFVKARYNLGVAYSKTGNKTRATEQYNELLKLDPALAAKLKDAMN